MAAVFPCCKQFHLIRFLLRKAHLSASGRKESYNLPKVFSTCFALLLNAAVWEGICSSISNFISGKISGYSFARLPSTVRENALMATGSVGDARYLKHTSITSPWYFSGISIFCKIRSVFRLIASWIPGLDKFLMRSANLFLTKPGWPDTQ